MRVDTLIYNARVVRPEGVADGYVGVSGQRIAIIGEGCPEGLEATERIDAGGALLMPGAIDEHVHFRDPGLTHKADMATESRAAAAGGVTSFIDMPNTRPVTTTVEAVEAKLRRAAETSVVNYGFYIGATNDNIEELLRADYHRIAGIKLFLGSSTGNMLVDNGALIEWLMTQAPALIAVHAESEEVIRANRERIVARHGADPEVRYHSEIRDRRACYEASGRIVEMARATGARLHLLHVSTADELALLDPERYPNITAETCPQYLTFSTDDYSRLGARIKCNPAIKENADREALRRAVETGLISCVGTDHAPHLLEEKRGGALTAVSGMPMIQFALPLMLTLGFSPATVARVMAENPARIYGIDRGRLSVGAYADMTLVAPEEHTVGAADVVSRCGWSPLEGYTLKWKVRDTWVGGAHVYNATRGLLRDDAAMALTFA